MFLSIYAGPQWRGGGGGKEGAEGAEEGGGGVEWWEPGCPMVQLKAMVEKPPFVLRVREASPPMAQTEINSVTEKAKELGVSS